ncbi:ZIP family metal transporter [Algibacter sp. L4_22]|uniref:ZIP family metal transporter n=1 Tax=Algibacter sp. L4_22 TaxID=2942477 RepID=UPI00201B8D49|nr:divalent cation transporter [Algibacter sp. L4_22]MCL5129294.1 divalent cation transporter [Algibacter sp. L4_22]
MTVLQLVLVYSLISGATVFLGGLLSYYFSTYTKPGLIKTEIAHSSIAFGGGILMAAVSLVLIPEGMKVLSSIPMGISFLAGAITFFFIDRYIEKKRGTMAQLLGMLSDFVPESITMGAVFLTNPQLGILLAIIIGIQNLPEAFNAYADLKSKYSAKTCLIILFLLSFSGVVSALLGYYFLSAMPMTVAVLMLFSSGGIIYLIFQDIAPLSTMKKNWVPALGACFGFLIGMIFLKMIT